MYPRRTFLLGLSGFATLLFLGGCERHNYDRSNAQAGVELDLGTVKSVLYTLVHIPLKSVLVFRDMYGWRALSTRCTYEGCDLTLQDQQQVLFCPCCKSAYNVEGRPFEGSKATTSLPWMEIFYKEGHLYAKPDKIVNEKYRFNDPKIEAAVRKLRMQVRDEKVSDGTKIPESLLGSRDPDDEGLMFLEKPPELSAPK
jgi:nitrite reductase/ring-hydroxylating ferredoxin subunit